MADSRSAPQPVQLYRLPPASRTAPIDAGQDCVVALRALGEDTRVRIIGLLLEAPLDVSEITRRVGVSQYNVSKHLRILREAGLLQVEKAGRRHLYALTEGIRGEAAAGSVLDLGCCSFQFDAAAQAHRSRGSGRRARRSTQRTARAGR